MNYKRKNKLTKSKWAILGTIGFSILGISAFIIGYGLADGWDKVLAWFSSQWAIIVYIYLGLAVIFLIWLFVNSKIKGE